MTGKLSLIMVLFLSILMLIVLLYSMMFLLLSLGIGRLKRDQARVLENPSPVALIIPFRDEKEHLSDLLGDLLKQSYPRDQLEVIFVNDHSGDGSGSMLNNLINNISHLRCLDLPENKTGKKEAILYAVQQSRSDWIIQTDADCRLGPDFIASHMAFHKEYPSDMVAGLITTSERGGGFLESFERLDMLGLVGAGAGSFHFGRPLMCSGANLAYSKELYLETRQFDPAHEVASGDDMFLMIGARKLGRSLAYNASPESMVLTQPVRTWGELIRQRIRWGSKTLYYRMTDIQMMALLVVTTNFLILVLPVVFCVASEYWPWLLSAFMVKTAADFLLLFRITGYTGQRRSLLAFLPVTLLYYIYQAVILAGALFKPFGWKGRSR